MNGVKGTTPGAEAPEDFRAALLEVDPALTDFSYAAESYDAVNLIALAAQAAGSDNGQAIAATAASRCPRAARSARTSPTARRCSTTARTSTTRVSPVPATSAENGDPTKATMGIYQYGADNKFASTAIKYVTGDVPAAS